MNVKPLSPEARKLLDDARREWDSTLKEPIDKFKGLLERLS